MFKKWAGHRLRWYVKSSSFFLSKTFKNGGIACLDAFVSPLRYLFVLLQVYFGTRIIDI